MVRREAPSRRAGGGSVKARAGSGAARFVAGAATPDRLPPPGGPEIAFAGRSNVGKSSLLNRLVGQHGLARVSKTPGRTQQINFFAVADGWCLVDLPGYGFARVPRAVQVGWRALVECYLTSRRNLRGVVVIIDVRRGVEEDDGELIDFLRQHGIPVRLAVTKIDKVGRGQRELARRALLEQWTDLAPVLVSALSGEGVPELRRGLQAWTLNRER